MNLVDCYVTEIIGEPYFKYGKWNIIVEYNSYGVKGTTVISDFTRSKIDAIDVGFKFLH